MGDAAAELEEALGAPPPAGVVDALAPEDLKRLAALVGEARREQRRALKEGNDSALKAIPFPLRAAVKKVLR